MLTVMGSSPSPAVQSTAVARTQTLISLGVRADARNEVGRCVYTHARFDANVSPHDHDRLGIDVSDICICNCTDQKTHESAVDIVTRHKLTDVLSILEKSKGNLK